MGNALEFAQFRHGVIGQNIANVNTPGFQTREAVFDQFLELAQAGSGEIHGTGDFEVAQTLGLTPRADGNNVDLDKEFGELKRNAMMFQTFSQLLAAKMDTMRRAMQG
ncbi:MAG: flagellar basal body rod protein FlgB [Planctomycetota bacterium]